jgi:uncharacterized membrane protein
MTNTTDHLRFQRPHLHLQAPFGDDWFGRRAEAFARFFGTPRYLLAQTALVLAWVALNAAAVFGYDPYPFILLNLAFSTQAAYAAPLILLAQTRQADRDTHHTRAVENLHEKQEERHSELLTQNRELITHIAKLTEQIKAAVDR